MSHETAIWKGSHNPRNRGLTITIVINHLRPSWEPDPPRSCAAIFSRGPLFMKGARGWWLHATCQLSRSSFRWCRAVSWHGVLKKTPTAVDGWSKSGVPADMVNTPLFYMGVSPNSGTPKSSIFNRVSIINHPFWGFYPYFWFNTHIEFWWKGTTYQPANLCPWWFTWENRTWHVVFLQDLWR